MKPEEIIEEMKKFEERENMSEEEKGKFEMVFLVLSVLYSGKRKEDSLQ